MSIFRININADLETFSWHTSEACRPGNVRKSYVHGNWTMNVRLKSPFPGFSKCFFAQGLEWR